MTKYNHALTVAFEVISDDKDAPTLEEALEGLCRRLVQLSTDAAEAHETLTCDLPFDTTGPFELCPDCKQRDGDYSLYNLLSALSEVIIRSLPAGDTHCSACR